MQNRLITLLKFVRFFLIFCLADVQAQPSRSLTVLAVNDVHRIAGVKQSLTICITKQSLGTKGIRG